MYKMFAILNFIVVAVVIIGQLMQFHPFAWFIVSFYVVIICLTSGILLLKKIEK